jgi:CRISPR-associated endonuclease/helicase Cas3
MMTSAYFPWGKLTRSTQPPATHSLLDHMTDVAAVMAVLVCQPPIARALEHTAGRSLHDSDRARLAALAFLHDLGKANAGFQGRYWDSE